MSHHIRNLATNDKLKRVYSFVQKTPMANTWQLTTKCKITNPGGIISEINKQIMNYGQRIRCYRVDIGSEKRFFYKLEKVS